MLKELGLTLAVASGLLASAQAQGGFGLALYVPHDVNTTSVTTTTWSGDFKAPLTTTLKGKADWAAFCVDVGANCYVEPLSEITTGNYTVMKELIDFKVTLDPTISNYTCYVATVLSKGMVCSDPIAVTSIQGNGREFVAAPPRIGSASAKSEEEVKPSPVSPPPKVVAPKKPAVVVAAPAPETEAVVVPPPKVVAPKKPAVVVAAPAPETEAVVVPPPKVVAPKKPAAENKATITELTLSEDQMLDDEAILL